MATVIKCDICGAEGAEHVRTLVNKKYSLDNKFYFYKELELDLCKNCISKASNIITDECEKVFAINSNTEMLHLNEGYINIYEADGKEELNDDESFVNTFSSFLSEAISTMEE